MHALNDPLPHFSVERLELGVVTLSLLLALVKLRGRVSQGSPSASQAYLVLLLDLPFRMFLPYAWLLA